MNYSLNYTKILLSALTIAFVVSLVFAGTQAFFSDEEVSEGNLFTAGALDLRVDSVAHFNNMICEEVDEDVYEWHAGPGDPFQGDDNNVPPEHYPQPGDPCDGTWEETDLGPTHKFFNFDDLKPGDWGENTISLHVINNDAWGCFYVENVENNDNGLTEPEEESGDNTGGDGEGELSQFLTFDSWLDEGTIPGFQCNHEGAVPTVGASCEEDPEEGDNIQNANEQLFWDGVTVDEASEGPFNQSDILAAAWTSHGCTDATGNTDYGLCHGLAQDGRMVGSATYYWGLAWHIPEETGNEIQTDSLIADMVFTATQHRNNPDFTCPVIEPDPEEGTLTLLKDVTNDDGGTAVDTDFTLEATGPDSISGIEGAPAVTSATVVAGTYDLSETGPAGYTASDWVCVGAALQDDGDTVTIADGEDVTCTITNDDDPTPQGTVTVSKTLVTTGDDETGDPVPVEADFAPYTVGATEVTLDAGTGFDVGTYTVGETSTDPDYIASISCDDDDFVDNLDGTGDITVEDGEAISCTFTNTFDGLDNDIADQT